jgi:hypothetical protein
VERLSHSLAAVGELVAIRGPHLEHRVGEAELEDPTGDRRVGGFVAEVDDPPLLLAAALVPG